MTRLGPFSTILIIACCAMALLLLAFHQSPSVQAQASTATPVKRSSFVGTSMAISATLPQTQATPLASTAMVTIANTTSTNTKTTPPIGYLTFADQPTISGGEFHLQLADLPQAPTGGQYVLWLLSTLTDTYTLCTFTGADDAGADGDVDITGTVDLNLPLLFNEARITLEPLNDQGRASNKITDTTTLTMSERTVLSALPSPSVIERLRPLLHLYGDQTVITATAEATSPMVGVLSAAQIQIDIAVQHTGFLRNALLQDDIPQARRHAEHIINILDGKNGFMFGDLDRNGLAENPGDGVGVRIYLATGKAALPAVADLFTAAATGTESADDLSATIDDSQALIADMFDKALQIYAADTVTEANRFAGELTSLVDNLNTTVDDVHTQTLQLVSYNFYGPPQSVTLSVNPAPGISTPGISTTGISTTGISTTGISTTGISTTGISTTVIATSTVSTTTSATPTPTSLTITITARATTAEPSTTNSVTSTSEITDTATGIAKPTSVIRLRPTNTSTTTATKATTGILVRSTTATPVPTSTPTLPPTPSATPPATATVVPPLPTVESSALTNPQAGTQWQNPLDGVIYIYVPGGSFGMGSESGEAASPKEEPRHEVTVEGFWLQQTETTNADYGRCVAVGECTPPTNERWDDPAFANHPVSDVTWQQANAYAAWAGGRLPTEAEWERSCRGDDARLYPWGNDEPTDERANYNNLIGDTAPVGSYPTGQSPYGLLDLSGNLWEWTSSIEAAYPYVDSDGREDADDTEANRTVRGGSFYYTNYQIRCAARTGFVPNSANEHIGFRLVLDEPYTVVRNPIDGTIYVYVPGGSFGMGSESGEAASPKEEPRHEVTVEGFWLQQTETTNADYGRCVAAGDCTPPTNSRWDDPAFANHPVSDVTWQQANAYAAWAGGRLPTEAEWERSCRGADERIYPWGNDEPTDERANYNNLIGDTAPIGSYPAGQSPYGLLDLSGNLWEWTSSIEAAYPYDASDGREDADDTAANRTVRGGSFYYTNYQIRCAARTGFVPNSANEHIGFRLVLAR